MGSYEAAATTVAVIGPGKLAAEWATRFLASGLDVVVDDPTVGLAVEVLWPAAQRLGLFPGADRSRLRTARTVDDLAAAALIQVVEGEVPSGCTGLIATEHTARGCSPVHLVPLVEIAGPQTAQLTEFYDSIGMWPVGADAPQHHRRQLGAGLVQLVDADPDALIAVMRALRPSGKGAGAAIARHEARRLAASAVRPWQPGDTPAAPLALYTTQVEPDWVDYNGHMTEAAYLTAAGWASDALFRYIGDDEAYRAAGHSFYTVETHIVYILEVDVNEPIAITTQVLGVDPKRLHLFHSMYHGDTGALVCTAEQMLLHVDMNAGRSAAIGPAVAAALAAIAAAHAPLPVPVQAGRVMRLPPVAH
jgi:acyl-CoA thioesterase FadM